MIEDLEQSDEKELGSVKFVEEEIEGQERLDI